MEAPVRPDAAWARLASGVALVGANLVPLFGVLAGGWDVFQVAVLYWFENVVIGALNVAKMLLASPDAAHLEAWRVASSPTPPARLHHATKAFLVPFFVVHYGIFTLVHGIFLFVFLGPGSGGLGLGGPARGVPDMVSEVWTGGGAWAMLALTASHVFSFVQNFVVGGEMRRTTVGQLMIAPYGRVVVLHVAILLGAFAVHALHSPTPLLVVLVAGKTILDLAMHRREHARAAAG